MAKSEYKFVVTRIEKSTYKTTQVKCGSMTAAIEQLKEDTKGDYYSVALTCYIGKEPEERS